MNAHMPDREILSRLLDQDLTRSLEARMRAHLSTCPDCREELEAIRALRADASALPELAPTNDLWAGISAAIAAEDATVDPNQEHRPRRAVSKAPRPRRFAPWMRQAIAATLLVVVAGSAGWLLRGESDTLTPASGTYAAAASYFEAIGLPANSLELIHQLEDALLVSRGELDEETRAVIEENLASLDHAIWEARQALAVEPGSEFLGAHFASAVRQKMRVLEQAQRLSGNEI